MICFYLILLNLVLFIFFLFLFLSSKTNAEIKDYSHDDGNMLAIKLREQNDEKKRCQNRGEKF